jgi:hypothetical protein
MTNSSDRSVPGDQPKQEVAPRQPLRANLAADLRDADGQFLSKGLANIYPGDKTEATFQPLDTANQDTIRTRARTLFLTTTNESLGPYEAFPCTGQCGQFLHFHLRRS